MILKQISQSLTKADFAYNSFRQRYKIFVSQDGIPFAVEKKTQQVILADKNKLSTVIRNLYLENGGGIIPTRTVNDVCETIISQMQLCEDKRTLAERLCYNDEAIYYNFGNEIIRIDTEHIKTIPQNKLGIYFKEYNGFLPQVYPDLNTPPNKLPELIDKIFNIKEEHKLLFAVYILSCFLPQINHPLLFLHGVQGSSKSTALRMIKKIVDPNNKDLFSLPKKDDDLFNVLSNNYFVPFDNIGHLSQSFSDILCQAVTNGSVSKRRLYTDNTETVINLHAIVAISGIEMSITRSDLLDRSITVHLERVSKTNRKTEHEIWECFNNTLPFILGAIFNAMKEAMKLHSSIKLDENYRMADFALWGYCFAETLCEDGGADFLKAYSTNISSSSELLVESTPLIFTVNQLMENRDIWEGTPTELLSVLYNIYLENSIDTRIPYDFPSNAIVLSKKLALVSENLKLLGLKISFKRKKERCIFIKKELQQ